MAKAKRRRLNFLDRCTTQAGSYYLARHNRALMISAATRVKEYNLVEEHESGCRQKWNEEQALENDLEIE